MNANISRKRGRLYAAATTLCVVLIATLAGSGTACAQDSSMFPDNRLLPGNLVVSRSVYGSPQEFVEVPDLRTF
jgi:hypothetical protein